MKNKNTLRLINGYSVKQIGLMLLSLMFLSFLPLFFLGSCSPNDATQDSGNTSGGSSDNPRPREVDSTCDYNDGDPCKDYESCVDVCAAIYEDWDSKRECQQRGDITVGQLEKVHNRLMGTNAGKSDSSSRSDDDVWDALNDISDKKDDIGISEMKCYLQIGSQKYIDELKKGLPNGGSDNDNKQNKLLRTLEWFARNENAAEALADVPRGDDILETILLELEKESAYDCLNDASSVDPNDQATNVNLWRLSTSTSDHKIYITIHKGGDTPISEKHIAFNNISDAKLYNALSCIHNSRLGNNSQHRNIFAFSAITAENQEMFNLAFELLSGICGRADTSNDEDKACARALMCWTAWKASSSKDNPDNVSDNFWEMAEEHAGDLAGTDSSYNECTAGTFSEFF